MNVNPLTVRFGYHYSRWRAQQRRRAFCRSLAKSPAPLDEKCQDRLPVEVVCMLGHSGVLDAIFALRSLVQSAGRPEQLSLVSDGSLTRGDAELLLGALPEGQIFQLCDFLADDLAGPVAERIDDSWMIAKQALLMSMPRHRPSLFVDSDMVFFEGASRLAADLTDLGNRAAYMVDVTPNFDERLLRKGDPRTPPVNSGLLYMPRRLDWSEAVARFAELPRDGGLSFTDQTMSHLAFHGAEAVPFDRDSYVLALDDQFEYGDRHAHRDPVVCRHYVNTIRHKMWMLA